MKKIYTLIVSLLITTNYIKADTIDYTVEKGETLYDISKAHHTTVAKICKLNHLKSSHLLKIGQHLTLPSKGLLKHKIKKGDTLSSIAYKNGTTIKKLCSLNGITTKSLLKIGQQLKIPHQSSKKKKLHYVKIKKRSEFIAIAKKKLGKRYVWGASGKHNTYDCSSFVKYVYKQKGINIPRTSRNQAKYGKYVKREKLKSGDLIFFDTSKRRKGYVNHVGMYIGDGKFIHASSAKKKVVITSLNKKFYSQRYKGARRPS